MQHTLLAATLVVHVWLTCLIHRDARVDTCALRNGLYLHWKIAIVVLHELLEHGPWERKLGESWGHMSAVERFRQINITHSPGLGDVVLYQVTDSIRYHTRVFLVLVVSLAELTICHHFLGFRVLRADMQVNPSAGQVARHTLKYGHRVM